MGWFTSVKDSVTHWGRTLWHRETVADMGNFSYQTISYLFQQIGVLPKVAYAMVNHPPTQKVVKHLARITVVDLAPLVIVSYTNHLLQTAGQQHLNHHEAPDQDPLSTSSYMTLQMGLYLLNIATWAYSVHAKLKLLVNTTLVTLEAPPAINAINSLPPNTVCTEANCSTLRFLQGSVRDLTTYFATEAAISLIAYIPIVGGTSAALLSVYHRGRYVLTVVLPDLCNRHQVIYLREYPELALSLGMGHAASTRAITAMIEATTGISPVFYNTTIEQLTLITQMVLAAQLNLPTAPLSSSRSTTDPVRIYQDSIGYIFDVFSKGLKTMVLNREKPKTVKELLQTIPWSSLYEKINTCRDFPLVHVVLPRSLHNARNFINDPIVRDSWPTLQNKLVNILKIIQSIQVHPAVKLSSRAPESAITILWLVLGTPKPLTRIILQLLNDEEVVEQLRQWQIQLERLSIDEPKKIDVPIKSYPLRGQDAPVLSDSLPEPQPPLAPTNVAAESAPGSVIRSYSQMRNPLNTNPSTPSLARMVIRQRSQSVRNSALGQGQVNQNPAATDEMDWVDLTYSS